MNRLFQIMFVLVWSLRCMSQVPVSQEPRHHNVFENAHVRILDVHIPAGDTSLMHKHSTPSVFLVLTKTRTGSQVVSEPHSIHLNDGNIWFEGFYDQPRIHRVWNSDTSEFHVIDMELLNKTPARIEGPIAIDSFRVIFDEKAVRGYRFTLSPAAKVQLPTRKSALVVIGLSDTRDAVHVNQKAFTKKGDYLFVESAASVRFMNAGGDAYSFAVFELK